MRFGRGIRRGTSAFYAGAVTLAMGGGMWLMPPTTASVAAPAQDCGGNGPLAVVTQGLCRVVGGLLDTVGNVGAALTGRELPDVEEKTTYQDFSGTGDGEAGEEATGREARDPRDTGAVPSPEATPRGRPDRRTGTGEEIAADSAEDRAAEGRAEDRTDDACAAAGCARGRDGRTGTGEARDRGTGERGRRRAETRRGTGGGDGTVRHRTPVGVTHPVRPGGEDAARERRPRPRPKPTERPRRAAVDEAELSLLLPVPTLPPIAPKSDGRVVTPRRPEDDVVGTALTAALLLSAVVAARVVSIRNSRRERPGTIPLEPAAARGSRHRLA